MLVCWVYLIPLLAPIGPTWYSLRGKKRFPSLGKLVPLEGGMEPLAMNIKYFRGTYWCGRLPGSGAGGQPQVHRDQEAFQAECCSCQNPPFLSLPLGGLTTQVAGGNVRPSRKGQGRQTVVPYWSGSSLPVPQPQGVFESGRQVFYNSAITTSNDLFLTLRCIHNFHLTHK